MTTTSQEVRCTLPEDEQQTRRAELRRGFSRRIVAAKEISGGIALALPLEAEAEARDFIDFEQGCCGFAGFALRREAGALVLEIRGPEGTRDFVRGLLPDGLEIERLAETTGDRRLLRAGLGGAAAALVVLLCCATPVLGLALGALGLAGLAGAAGFWADAVAIPLLLASLTLLAWAWLRKRRPRPA